MLKRNSLNTKKICNVISFFRMSDIENLLYEVENRGQEFFDQTFR